MILFEKKGKREITIGDHIDQSSFECVVVEFNLKSHKNHNNNIKSSLIHQA